MRKNKFNILFIMILSLIIFNTGINNVYAVTYAAAPKSFNYKYVKNGSFHVNSSTGQIGNGIVEAAKYATFGGKNNAIYCSEWKRHLGSNKYLRYGKKYWNPYSKRAIVSGYISYYFNPKNKINVNTYAKVGVTINHYLATSSNPLAGSMKFNKLLSEYKTAIEKAKNYYDNNKTNIKTTSLKKPKFNPTRISLSSTTNNGVYKTPNITISNLDATQYGSKVTHKLNITTNNSRALVRIGTSGSYETSISKTITGSGTNSEYSFTLYIKADGSANIAGTKINVAVTANNSSTYYTSYLYHSEKQNGKQRLIYPGTITIKRQAKNSMTFNVPQPQKYNIYINKTDEEGTLLKGAQFKLKYNNNDLTLSNDNAGTFSWDSGTSTNSYDFSKFSLEEITAPNGYIKLSEPISFSAIEQGENCLDRDGNLVTDKELCRHESYKYMCVGTDGSKIDLNESGNCEQVSNSTEPSTTENNTGTETNTEEGSTESVTYTKKCLKTDTEVDNKYCDSVGNYFMFVLDGRSLSITIPNKINTVTVSKSAITGDDEIPGAELKICTKQDYKNKGTACNAYTNINNTQLTWISSSEPYDVKGLVPGDYAIIETIEPDGYEKIKTAVEFNIDETGTITSSSKTTVKNEDGTNSDIVVVKNKLNQMTISKQDIATSKELPGAKISICTAITSLDGSSTTQEDSEEYEGSDISDDSEDTDEDGDDTNNSVEEDTEANDNSNYEDKKYAVDKNTGECIPAVLADGSRATWTSGTTPHTIKGLPAGTYYLVENTAPIGYSTAEEILFKMNSDGTITDKNGKSLANNKLVMKDAPLKDVKTGIFKMVSTIVVSISAVALGFYAYVKRLSTTK